MPNKRKSAAAAIEPAPKAARGGGGRGAGRKPTGVNTKGVDAEDAPKRKQTDLAPASTDSDESDDDSDSSGS